MDSKLYFTVTLVVLAWVSVATTQAQTTTASTNTMATANTTASTNTMATANTTASTSVTAAPNTTASTSVTAAPPLTPNNTVTPLETNLNNSECGNKTLCVSEPANCNPGSGSCSFFSARQKSGQNFEFALAGETDGYIAAVISSDTTLGGNDTTYVCFNNNGSVKFTGAILNNTQLTKQNVNANNVRGRVNGRKIQCVFDATLPALSARTTNRTIGVITGTYNNSASTFGAANTVIRTNAVDLSSPTIVQNLATPSTTAAPSTTASTSVTAAPSTTASTDTMATANTTASTDTMATATTTASTDTTATATTTASTDTMATANTTASTSVTAAPSTTASTSVTAAPPLTPNNTVTPLETNLNNSGCGTQKLCVNEPTNCDPGSGSCSFFSARQKSGQNFGFALAGETDGYIAAVLSSDPTLGGNDTTYVCFNNNGNVKFTGASLNNNQLTKQNVNANNVRGRVNGRKIQCVFDATLPALSARTTSRTIGVITGTYNNSAGTFGAANIVIRTNAVDLSSPNATVQNLATTNTTTNNAVLFRQTLIQALFISAGVMGLAVL